jgi:hypothetical protein
MKILALLGALSLAGCDQTRELAPAEEFFARIDQGRLDKAWDMLVDEDKAAVDKPFFVDMYTDTSHITQYDTLIGTQVIDRSDKAIKVHQLRKVPDWNLVRSLRMRGRSMRELAASLSERRNLRMVLDSSRVVTVVGTGAKARISIGLAKQAKYHRVLDSLLAVQPSLVRGAVLGVMLESNINTFSNATVTISSESEVELGGVVFDVTWRGQPFGTWAPEQALPPRRSWTGKVGIKYAVGIDLSKLPRAAATLPGSEFEMKLISAIPMDATELRLKAERISGVEPLELL